MTTDPRTLLERVVAEVAAACSGSEDQRGVPPVGPSPEPAVHLVPAADGPGWHSAQAIRLARAAGTAPVDLARTMAEALALHDAVARAGVVGAGMLHVVLTPRASGTVVAAVQGDEGYGRRDQALAGEAVALPGPGERRRGHPVFSVVWAHSRATAVAGVAEGLEVVAAEVGDLLSTPTEDALLTGLAAFPDDVSRAADRTALLARLDELAGRTHGWLDDDVVLPRTTDDPVEPVHHARVALAAAAARVLATGLDLLGLPAPPRV